MHPMKILFSTGSLSRLPVDEVFSLVRTAGFDGCELVVGKEFNRPERMEEVVRCLSILPIYSLHAPYVHIAAWGDEAQALARAVRLAGELGARVLTFHPPSWLAREFKYYRWFRKVRDFRQELGSGDISLNLENMPLFKLVIPPYILNNFERLIRFGLERNLSFTYDVTHIGTYGHDIVDVFLLYAGTGRLTNIHLSDYSLWREKSHLGIGRGELPIVRLLNTMRRVGYDGMVTVEIAPQELPRTDEWLLKVMSYTAAYLRLHLGLEESGTVPAV
jgi:sugar phosphate isomerase/epimerase